MAEKPSPAQEALHKVDDQLICPACLDPYTDPRLLQCFHVYCHHCLLPIVVSDQQGQLSISCPQCRRPTTLPSAGVAGLQEAFHIHHLFDIQKTLQKVKEPHKMACEKCTKTTRLANSFCRQCTNFICETCTSIHKEWEEFEAHEIVSIDQVEGDLIHLISPTKTLLCCAKHDKKLTTYCYTCEELICKDCTTQIHREHEYCVISDTFDTHKEDILSSLEPVKKQLELTREAVSSVEARHEEITEHGENLKINIHARFEQLLKLIRESEQVFNRETDQIIDQKLKDLDTQREEIEVMQTQLSSCLHIITESIRTGSQGEIMKSKHQLIKQVKELTESFDPKTLRVHTQSNLTFSPGLLIKSHKDFGFICSVFIDNDSERIMAAGVEEKASAILHILDVQNEPCTIPLSNVEGHLVTIATGDATNCTVAEQDKGCYEVSFQPSIVGLHQLLIEVGGKCVRGSPFSVMVKRPIGKLSSIPVRTIDGLNGPRGVAINKKREIIVCEADSKCVSIFTPALQKMKTISQIGNVSLGELHGIAIDRDDNLLVLDKENCLLHKLSPSGELIKSVGNSNRGPLQFLLPSGIDVNNQIGNIYIVDWLAHSVFILNSDLTFVSKFDSEGSGDGQFINPSDIAHNSTGNVYIADCCNHRIQVFTHDGCYLRKFGVYGRSSGELKWPVSICIDCACDDIVYVGELGNHRVSIFNSEGIFLKMFGLEGSGPGQFNMPVGIALDQCGLLYVSDYKCNTVQMF